MDKELDHRMTTIEVELRTWRESKDKSDNDRHFENKRSFETLFEGMNGMKEALSALPCKVHAERMTNIKSNLNTGINRIWAIISIIIVSLLGVGIYIGRVLAVSGK